MKIIFIILFILANINNSFSAGSSSDGSSKQKTNYEKAVSLINSAKNYERKVRLKKLKKGIKKHKIY